MFRLFLWLLTVCALTAGHGGPAAAYESAPVATKRTTATLIAASGTIGPDGTARIGLRLRLADGWHTYWRNPGESGIPTELAFVLPPGASAGSIEWPTPARISEGSIVTYGFTREVVLPAIVTLTPGTSPPGTFPPGTLPPGTASLTGELRANWLVCKEVCIPEEASFTFTFPAGSGAASPEAALFQAHDRATPRTLPWAATLAPNGTLYILGPELNPDTVADAWFVPETPGQIADGAAQLLSVRGDGIALGLRLAEGFAPASGLRGVLSLRDRSGGQTDVMLAAAPGPVPAPELGLPRALFFAFLGGLILNLMPCVFPILAMKAVGFAAGLARGTARAHALSYTAGVMATFAALAVSLLVARGAGMAAGWGFQFASPVFVAAMAWLLFAAGLNLSGVFQIGAGFAGAGNSLATRQGHWGSFFTGALAVLVATPCTAPFMSVAIAAGLAASPPVAILVFLLMGLGLATPFLALSFVPALARAMPRPGRWMEIFRQILAFPMYGAAVWLLWVVSQEAGPEGVLAVATGFVLLGFAGWSIGVTRGYGHPRLGLLGAGIAVALMLATLTGLGATPPGPAAERGVEAFSTDRLAALRAEGRPVFVNLTAAWCVTCLVNERIAIGTDSVRRAFGARHVAYLKGDWTRQDPAIGAFLRAHGRDGVPLYLYYAPQAREPDILPQLLTEATMLDVLAKGS